MYVTNVRVKNVRSIANAELMQCGDFNVLIGKNNSGKSNILTAIRAFFGAMSEDIISLSPPLRATFDFHNNAHSEPIDITLTFKLSADERATIVSDLIEDAPQRRNAAEALTQDLELDAALEIRLEQGRPFAFVQRLTLVQNASVLREPRMAPQILLEVSLEAARELCDNLRRSQERQNDVDALDRVLRTFDEGDWERSRGESTRSRASGRLLYQPDIPPQIMQQVESTLRKSDSYTGFVSDLISLREGALAKVAELRVIPLNTRLQTFAGEESDIPTYVRRLLRKLSDIKVLYLTDRRDPIGQEEATRLLTLKVTRGGPEGLQKIQQTVRQLIGVRIDAFRASEGARPRLGVASRRGEPAELDVDDFLVEVNGSGIREALRLVLDVEFNRPNLLLVEEPEMHLHPALEVSVMRYLRHISTDASVSTQIFITTHSTNFLDTADMRNVYLVSKSDDRLRATHVELVDVAEAESRLPTELGLRLSSLFMFDRLVFVEGPTDEAVLRELASLVNVNLSAANVGFVAMGGVRNLGYFATEATLSFLSKRRVGMCFLIDRDERDMAEVERLKRRVGDRAVVKVLSRRELENYLVVPRALAEFIRLKLRGSAAAPEATDVQEVMERVIGELRPVVVSKRLMKTCRGPFFVEIDADESAASVSDAASRVSSGIQALCERLHAMREEVDQEGAAASLMTDEQWDREKFTVVPGDLLLDRVCREFGVRFVKKGGDGSRLASLLTAAEVDRELVAFMNEIGS